uniref:Resistance to inhibitors of cholinesterase protein 3 N-terminal domain-containing protein n=2 Tax=Ciona intestinalis TaxID=7719 RepID=F7BER6_CIOIN
MAIYRVLMYGGLGALFISIVVPYIFFGSKARSKYHHPAEKEDIKFPSSNLPPNFGSKHAETRTQRQGWASTLAPVYTVIVLIYISYVMYKITTRKKRSPYGTEGSNKKATILWKKGNQKTKITQYELNQLEKKLLESEEAVEKILKKANDVITAAFEQAEAESITSSDSDDGGDVVERISSTESQKESSQSDEEEHSHQQSWMLEELTTEERRRVLDDINSEVSSEENTEDKKLIKVKNLGKTSKDCNSCSERSSE